MDYYIILIRVIKSFKIRAIAGELKASWKLSFYHAIYRTTRLVYYIINTRKILLNCEYMILNPKNL